jgi:hypothetical protein
MFKFTYILLFFAFINAKAQEPDLVWEKNYHDIHSMFFLNDTTLLMHGSDNGGVTYFINPENGIAFDSIIHGVNDLVHNKVSPNKKILASSGRRNGILIDIEKKVLIKIIDSKRDITFKDDENLYVMDNENSIYLLNFDSNEKELIWSKEVFTYPQNVKLFLGFNSRFSYDGKYAIPTLDGGYFVNLETKEVEGGSDGQATYEFNPTNFNEFIVYGGEQIQLYNVNDLKKPYHKIYFEEKIIGNHYGTYSEDGNYFAVSYLGWIRIYDLETHELKSKVYLPGVSFNFKNNFLFLNRSGAQYKYDISSYLSIESNSYIDFEVFPNPNNGFLTFNFDLEKSGKYDIKIINSVGQEVYKEDLGYLQKGQNNITKELTLINGTYYTTITNGIDLYKTQFIINK